MASCDWWNIKCDTKNGTKYSIPLFQFSKIIKNEKKKKNQNQRHCRPLLVEHKLKHKGGTENLY